MDTYEGRRVGTASKTDEGIVGDMITAQLRWATKPLEEYFVLYMGRLDALNGPAAYLYPTYETADTAAAHADAHAMSRGIDREIKIGHPPAVAA